MGPTYALYGLISPLKEPFKVYAFTRKLHGALWLVGLALTSQEAPRGIAELAQLTPSTRRAPVPMGPCSCIVYIWALR